MKTIKVYSWSDIPPNFTGKATHTNGVVAYYKNSKWHREDGLPAIEFTNGDKVYFKNGLKHREDGPAIEYANGHKEYYINGLCHKIGGHAVEWAIGKKFYYINGYEVTKEAHDLLYNMLKLKEIKAL